MTRSRSLRMTASTNPPVNFTPGNRRFLPPVPLVNVNPMGLLDEPAPKTMGNRSSHFRRISGTRPDEKEETEKKSKAPALDVNGSWEEKDVITIDDGDHDQANEPLPPALKTAAETEEATAPKERKDNLPAVSVNAPNVAASTSGPATRENKTLKEDNVKTAASGIGAASGPIQLPLARKTKTFLTSLPASTKIPTWSNSSCPCVTS